MHIEDHKMIAELKKVKHQPGSSLTRFPAQQRQVACFARARGSHRAESDPLPSIPKHGRTTSDSTHRALEASQNTRNRPQSVIRNAIGAESNPTEAGKKCLLPRSSSHKATTPTTVAGEGSLLLLVGDGGRGGAEAGDARGVRGGRRRGRVCHVPPRRHACQLHLLLSLLPVRDLNSRRRSARLLAA
jgi:hypothetical protein